MEFVLTQREHLIVCAQKVGPGETALKVRYRTHVFDFNKHRSKPNFILLFFSKIEENCLHQIDITHYSVLIAFMNSDVDECLFSPCGDKVPCINELGSYSCQCFSGWTGKNCTEGRLIL